MATFGKREDNAAVLRIGIEKVMDAMGRGGDKKENKHGPGEQSQVPIHI
jgi:hypothetical protein